MHLKRSEGEIHGKMFQKINNKNNNKTNRLSSSIKERVSAVSAVSTKNSTFIINSLMMILQNEKSLLCLFINALIIYGMKCCGYNSHGCRFNSCLSHEELI